MMYHLPASFPEVVTPTVSSFIGLSSYVKHNQLACQHRPQDFQSTEDRLGQGCGSFHRRRVDFKDEDFTELSPEFKYLKDLVDTVDRLSQKKTVRLRIMNLAPKTCLSYHTDSVAWRWHLPLVTSPSAFFIVEGTTYKMPRPGQVYVLKTDVLHTAINANYDQARIHLVGSLV